MNAFTTLEQVISNYRKYLKSFLNINDKRILEVVNEAFENNGFIPEPLIQFNPSFQKGESLQDLAIQGIVNPTLINALGSYNLYKHQVEAIKLGSTGNGFVVTSGTGSGKSLTFLATIFNSIFNQGVQKKKGVKAILVYPMNALINSQEEEIKKYAEQFGSDFPITFAKYTGQEGQEKRESIKTEVPDIILTNYMMLELIMTRQSESWLRNSLKDNLSFLIFDELHTYRGRQGSDVSMLIRRLRSWCNKDFVAIGTSATMATKGTPLQKKEAVAKVATTIFGKPYTAEHIIGEYLEPCTGGLNINAFELKTAFEKGMDDSLNEEAFVNHPITNWLELNVALKSNEGVLERGIPKSLNEIAELVKSKTELDLTQIKKVLENTLQWAEQLNEKNRKNNTRKSFLPFRFHQFISQTSTVSVTLAPRSLRSVSIQAGRYIKDENGEQLLYPILFSRYSGIDFICVEKDVDNKNLKPRNPDDLSDVPNKTKATELTEKTFCKGYVVFDEGEEFWNDDLTEILPLEWFDKKDKLQAFYDWQLPKLIYFDSKGNYSDKPDYPLKGYYMPAKLRIDPTAGIIYDDSKLNESTKLMRLGSEGRSTATTILSYSVVDSLFEQNENAQDQKLLSFTDNRQDAALQAGHFNDFISSIRLRAGLYAALQNNPNGLNVHEISDKVFQALNLSEHEYATNESKNPNFPDDKNHEALKAYLLYRIFQDLKRGWRYTLPNLEQTALIKIEYQNLKKLCSLDNEFQHIELFNKISADKREKILTQILNYFRTNYAIDHRFILDQRLITESFIKDKLNSEKLWSLDIKESIETPTYMVPKRPGRSKNKGIFFATMGSRSGIGKYLKREFIENGIEPFKQDDYNIYIKDVCKVLEEAGILTIRKDIEGSRGKEDGYLLRADCLIWLPENGVNVTIDETRLNNYKELNIKPNEYFQNLYKTNFSKYPNELVGREHTGQISSADRITREENFRQGKISSMFCSPTMELGIDIANLNIVHMRNVPPNPSNYAQRSGRAGRGGQTAVVFTYCSAMSPHDQNYFKAAATMVAGTVLPPRIDLINEELLTTHFNAYILMELGIEELKASVADILDLTNESSIQVKNHVLTLIDDGILHHKATWIAAFKKVVNSLDSELKEMYWFNDLWFENTLNSFNDRFQKSFLRWINLYLSAKKMIYKSRIVIDDPTIKTDSEIKKDANRQHYIGLKQVGLLKNDSTGASTSESEFYIFRYLAAEGFLPGYNFTRLPVRTFLGHKHNNQGEYVSRPRTVALKEFGPNNTIYHNGNKFKINRMMLLDADVLQRKIKISKETGYAFLDDEASLSNVDPITKISLVGSENVEIHNSIIELSESEGIPQERISCIEEERMSSGYEIEEYFRYSRGIEHVKEIQIQSGGEPILNLLYDQATELIKINKKSKRAPENGFDIDKRNGKWLSKVDLENEQTSQNSKNVMVFVRDTADTLYIQPLSNLDLKPEQVISLSYALKRGIEKVFQVEENEIGVRVLGKQDSPNVLIYESSEGSIGVLSQLVQEPAKLKDVFEAAYQCIHFDVETRLETENGKSLPRATYEDLLSYYNQRDHEVLDRHSISEILEKLMDCDLSTLQGGRDRNEQYKMLLQSYDKNSSTELPLLKYLFENNLALPDKAQVNMDDYYISADFVYNTKNGPVILFCDGGIHLKTEVKLDDSHKRTLLRDAGFDVIEWPHTELIEMLIKRRSDVFRNI